MDTRSLACGDRGTARAVSMTHSNREKKKTNNGGRMCGERTIKREPNYPIHHMNKKNEYKLETDMTGH